MQNNFFVREDWKVPENTEQREQPGDYDIKVFQM